MDSSYFSFITMGTPEELSDLDGKQVADATFLVADIVAREEGDVEYMTLSIPKPHFKRRLRYNSSLNKFGFIAK